MVVVDESRKATLSELVAARGNACRGLLLKLEQFRRSALRKCALVRRTSERRTADRSLKRYVNDLSSRCKFDGFELAEDAMTALLITSIERL